MSAECPSWMRDLALKAARDFFASFERVDVVAETTEEERIQAWLTEQREKRGRYVRHYVVEEA